MAKDKHFILKYSVVFCDTELNFFHLAEGKNADEVEAEHEVEHDACGLDTEDSPVGGCVGEKCTELETVREITPAQKKFLNKIGIY